MKRIGLCLSLVLLFLVTISCSDKLKSDVREAHELMGKSIEATLAHDYETADKFFQQYKEIENHYKSEDKLPTFEKAYWEYVSANKN